MINFKVPKKYQKYFASLEKEGDLIEGCKYMLYFADGFGLPSGDTNVPVKSYKEALHFLKEAIEV